MSDKPVVCPNCAKPLSASLVAKAAAESEITLAIDLKPGEFLGAHTLGGVLLNFDKLIKAASKPLGMTSTVLVKGLSATDGSVEINMLIARTAKGRA